MRSPKFSSPPMLAVWFIKRLDRYRTNHAIVDDMQEVFMRISEERGHISACLWYWGQCLDAVIKDALFNAQWRFIMLMNYLKIALRTIKRNKVFSFINIIGLAVGLACSFLISAYVFDEMSFDRFHNDADRIYRITFDFIGENSEDKGLLTSYILAKTLREDYPERFQVTQIKLWGSIVSVDSKSYGNERIIGADSSFFDMFTYQLLIGNPKTSLQSPNEAIITDEAATKYFGDLEAVGRTIEINGKAFQISGIIKNEHRNSHFNFDVLFSLNSLSNYGDTRYLYGYYSTYVKLPPSVPESRLKNILDDYTEKNLNPLFVNTEQRISLGCEPLLALHLHSDLNGPYGANSKIEYVYIFSVIALLILVIACINYVNLTTAKNLKRAREVGIRKVVGSINWQINKQFLLESVIFCWMAMGFALILIKMYLPFFNDLIGKSLQINYLSDPWIIVGIIGFAAIIGIMAGIYPSLYLSSFKPIDVLKESNPGGQKKFRLQSALVVFQFTVSVLFMIGTLVINKQLGLVQKKDLGFDKEHVIVLHGGSALGRQKEVFKNNLLNHPDILSVSGTSSLPGRDFSTWSITPEEIEANSLGIYFCDHNFAETMGIDIQMGRFFSAEFPSDERAIVINEKAAQKFGWAEDPIGKKIQLNVHGDYTVIGVVKDFYYESLHNKLENMGMLLTQGRYYGSEAFLAIKFSSKNVAGVIDTIKKEWNSLIPNAPFEYSFLDEDYYLLYRSEQQMKKIAMIFSFLALLISSLGIFGLVSISVDKRKKEIGVRKILGASVANIELLLSKEFMKWTLLANAIAYPIAYFAMNKWLNNFAYRAPLTLELFVIPGTLAFGVALIVVSIKVIRASVANPVDSLRHE